MTQEKNNTDLTEFLLKGMAEPDPMLSMLEWLCAQLMEAEVSGLVGRKRMRIIRLAATTAADIAPGGRILA